MEYSLFRQFMEESLGWTVPQWIAEYENVVSAADTESESIVPKLMLCSCSSNDEICNQWISFIMDLVDGLKSDDADQSLLCQFGHCLKLSKMLTFLRFLRNAGKCGRSLHSWWKCLVF